MKIIKAAKTNGGISKNYGGFNTDRDMFIFDEILEKIEKIEQRIKQKDG